MPTGLEMKNSIAVQKATAIQRSTENNGESVPVQRRKGDLRKASLETPFFTKKGIQKINSFASRANKSVIHASQLLTTACPNCSRSYYSQSIVAFCTGNNTSS